MADQNNVKVIEKNAGPKIAYEQTGTCLIFGDYELMINAAKYQKDWDVTVDICKDKAGNLTIGTESGLRYVAQVMIPAATYTETPIQTGGRNAEPHGRRRRRRHEPRHCPERAEPARHGRRYARTLEH